MANWMMKHNIENCENPAHKDIGFTKFREKFANFLSGLMKFRKPVVGISLIAVILADGLYLITGKKTYFLPLKIPNNFKK